MPEGGPIMPGMGGGAAATAAFWPVGIGIGG
jgi:hypothetical protein